MCISNAGIVQYGNCNFFVWNGNIEWLNCFNNMAAVRNICNCILTVGQKLALLNFFLHFAEFTENC